MTFKDGIISVQPDRSWPHSDVQYHLYPRVVHHVHHLVKPRKCKLSVAGFVAVPSQVPHPHHPKTGGLHKCDVMSPRLRIRVMGMVFCADIKLLGRGGAGKRQRRSNAPRLCLGTVQLSFREPKTWARGPEQPAKNMTIHRTPPTR